ncbi:hypothetical protein M3223_02460 [Paenibacillus pasadenensis]|uniref:hypothetical protein n=1 Tax=Paenibacillus pasadenensis TaxID=217090 RepID=UPI00203D1995|nr:hypothetical protein [Paenibacillus pasadenensis]MCM3746212.1 hypothetical protein [Paenibacillus pasadenensis]
MADLLKILGFSALAVGLFLGIMFGPVDNTFLFFICIGGALIICVVFLALSRIIELLEIVADNSVRAELRHSPAKPPLGTSRMQPLDKVSKDYKFKSSD